MGCNWTNLQGVLLHYLNGSWSAVTTPTVSSDWGLMAVHFTSSNEGWAIGSNAQPNYKGVLLHYLNGSWTFIDPADVSLKWGLDGVSFSSPNSGWAVGGDFVNGKGVLLNFSFTPKTEEVVFAVNCGGPQYTDKAGIVYQADTRYSGGQIYTNSAAIAGTDDDLLYQSERFGNFSYRIPLPNGNYQVTLKFAEIYAYCNSAGIRVFDVKIEGNDVLIDFDLFARAGKYKSYNVPIMVKVDDGILNLNFSSIKNNAKINAILITTASPPPPQEVIFAVNCGGPQYTDKAGLIYQADTRYSGGQIYTSPAAIAGTDDDLLYQSERFGNFSYKIPLPNGTYTVLFKFSEIYPYSFSGSRVFNVKIEGQRVVKNLDIFSKAGKNKAYDLTIPLPVTVSDGVMHIDFYNDRGSAKVNAIVVMK